MDTFFLEAKINSHLRQRVSCQREQKTAVALWQLASWHLSLWYSLSLYPREICRRERESNTYRAIPRYTTATSLSSHVHILRPAINSPSTLYLVLAYESHGHGVTVTLLCQPVLAVSVSAPVDSIEDGREDVAGNQLKAHLRVYGNSSRTDGAPCTRHVISRIAGGRKTWRRQRTGMVHHLQGLVSS